jgi:hypothetical protein
MNEHERAVIEAARKWREQESTIPLRNAVDALTEHEASTAAAGVTEIPWREVAAGDQLRARSGKFYPVSAVLAIAGAKARVTVQLPDGPKQLMRPTEVEPRAVVKRGQDGKAVDMFVNVFSSGG